MDKFVGGSPVVLVGMLPVLRVREGEVALPRRPELHQLVNAVLSEKTAVVVANVAVPPRSVRTVVHHLALGRHCPVCLHNKIIANYHKHR